MLFGRKLATMPLHVFNHKRLLSLNFCMMLFHSWDAEMYLRRASISLQCDKGSNILASIHVCQWVKHCVISHIFTILQLEHLIMCVEVQTTEFDLNFTHYWPGLLCCNFFGQPGSVSKFPPFLWVKLWVGWVGRGYTEIIRYFPASWINWVTLVTKIKLLYSLRF